MLRRAAPHLVALGLSLVVASTAAAGQVELMPGVTLERQSVLLAGGAATVYVVTTPKPGGSYTLRPMLSNDAVLGRETVTRMQRRVSGQATAVGVNGDLFNWATGHPSGIYLHGGVLASRPIGGRSTLGIGLDGILRVARINFYGSVAIGDAERHPLAQFNRPLEPRGNEIGLFTPRWGSRTPRLRHSVDVVLESFPSAEPNTDLAAVAGARHRGGGTAIPPGGAVLQASGFWAAAVKREAKQGVPLTVRLILKPWWSQVQEAIGGGPVLVRHGKAIPWAGEEFLSSQLSPRYPRTAVGQLADGRIILVAVDGREGGSRGMSVPQLAREMADLGAVTAMALDAGGSTTVAFDGDVLNHPSGGGERAVSDSLMVLYDGAYAPPARHRLVSPNGDGVADSQRLASKVVRPSHVSLALTAPDGSVAWQDEQDRDAGTVDWAPPRELLAAHEGRWTWSVKAVDAAGTETADSTSFVVNGTLGFLELSHKRLRVPPKRAARVQVRFQLAHQARVKASVVNRRGRVVRWLKQGTLDPGTVTLSWNGRNNRGGRVASGRYDVRVVARNELGKVSLDRGLTVRKLHRKHKHHRR